MIASQSRQRPKSLPRLLLSRSLRHPSPRRRSAAASSVSDHPSRCGTPIYPSPMATRPKDEAKGEGTDGAQSNGTPEAEQKAAVDEDLHRYIAPVLPEEEREDRVITDSGIPIKRLYEQDDVKPALEERLGDPGEYPFTRGIH